MAAGKLSRERSDHTLQATELANEAYLRLQEGGFQAESRRHFYGAAAEAMRRILVDHARRRNAAKRNAGQRPAALPDQVRDGDRSHEELVALSDALDDLDRFDARKAEVVRLKFFVGLTLAEIAGVVGVDERTVKRDWEFAQSWLASALGEA